MRKIKFRSWNYMKKEMSYQDIHGIVLGYLGTNLNEKYLMQFTGLLDKHGKEIYEGDIVKLEHPISDVIRQIVWYIDGWKTARLDTCNKHCNPKPQTPNYSSWNDFEIIGNIHENPELINVR